MDPSLNEHYSDMLSILNEEQVDFLLVGGWAFGFHVARRYTEAIDLWVRPSAENAKRVMKALRRFGAPLGDATEEDFAKPRFGWQFGNEPLRIDVLTTLSGITFDDAWKDKVQVQLGGVKVYIIGRQQLKQNKRAAGRRKDLDDLRWLEDTDNG